MSEIKIRIRDDGPLVLVGSITVVDAEGDSLALPTDKPTVALCRCGASESKPFCDGSHKSSGFRSVIRAGDARPSDE